MPRQAAPDPHTALPPSAAAALSAREFAELMQPLAPFEPAPRLAVAVSGGADSMALLLLAAGWARRRKGDVVGLTVDHGLRAGSAAEARQVACWLRRRGIAHRVLRWQADKPARGLQAAARTARYRLLADWCRRHGVLHLLSAHHRDDQAETVLLRLERNSGPAGLAAMPAAAALPGVRLLRPLLAVPGGRLLATLRRRRQPWLEDPSNRDPRFARTRLRGLLATAGARSAAALAGRARRAGRARQAAEARLVQDAAAAVALSPAGYAVVRGAWWRAAGAGRRRDLLAALLRTLGGGAYPPRGARRERLLAALDEAGFAGRTLAGCRILEHDGDLLICREAGRLPPPVTLRPGRAAHWDRFRVSLAGAAAARGRAWTAGALGAAGWRELRDAVAPAPPAPVAPGLPALRHRGALLAVPHLHYVAPGFNHHGAQFSAVFAPPNPLSPAVLRVV